MEKSASWCLDIVTPSCRTSSCFTKAYSRYLKGAGSVLLMDSCDAVVDDNSALIPSANESAATEDVDLSETIGVVGVLGEDDIVYDTVPNTVKKPRIESMQQSTASDVSAIDVSSDARLANLECPANNFRKDPTERTFDRNWQQQLQHRRVRYFAPSEMIKIFGFSTNFRFPPSMSNRKCYELIGNSINVVVASHVLTFMFDI